MPWLCCHRKPKSKREDQYKVADEPEQLNVEEHHEEAMFSWDRRPKMDIDRYRIHDLDGATEIRRGAGGQPMAIESCKSCNLLVLEHTSTITVDDCSDCLIVLAPCAGSVFLRDCQSCTVLVACQQLRTRDCRTLRIALHCATQPIIEETSSAVFHPLVLHYDSFTDDLVNARLSPFSSHSSSVHDFTPEKGSLHYRISNDALTLSPEQVAVLTSHGVSTNLHESDIPSRQEPLGKRNRSEKIIPQVEWQEQPERSIKRAHKLNGSLASIISHYFHAVCNDARERLTFVERCQKVAQAVVISPSLRLVSTNEIDLQKHGSKIGMPTKTQSTLVVLEVCGDVNLLDQLMNDRGFEKVPEHEESTFASALVAINQIMLS